MKDSFRIEENALTQRERYFGETREDVEDRLISCNDSIFGGVLGRGVEDLWRAIRSDCAAMNYLAEVYAERTGSKVRTIQEDGIHPVRCMAKEILFASGRLPVEIHERFERRKNSDSRMAYENYVFEREVLSLEDL